MFERMKTIASFTKRLSSGQSRVLVTFGEALMKEWIAISNIVLVRRLP